ncbi:hypothetical protein HYPSUDRAFT_44963 [Hypholoma sublateritium FD-334 SS-4]|uniref:Uncharacterized protein n=1 Tax=Hypholoma sublateritium (strain FD-334 SS-4) TaxID=945553 RepID=A0A0D2M6J2_HYPSF|nr:hypothetical protein HYPSUDRAFT_44963 [Hypholoma sublateritium FD-334 SS-4]
MVSPSYTQPENGSPSAYEDQKIPIASNSESLPPQSSPFDDSCAINYSQGTPGSQLTQGLPLSSSFARKPPMELSYDAFQPMFLVAKSKALDEGFPAAPPPSNTRAHPFPSHDITEADWLSFLKELETSAALTADDVRKSYLPIISIVPVVKSLSSYGVQQYMKSQKRHKVVEVIDMWNRSFFGLRNVRVILMRGQTPLSPSSTEVPEQYSAGLKSPTWNLAQTSAGWTDDIFRLLVVPL